MPQKGGFLRVVEVTFMYVDPKFFFHILASRDRIVVSTLRCGRNNPGSNPGHGTLLVKNVISKNDCKIYEKTTANNRYCKFFTNLCLYANESRLNEVLLQNVNFVFPVKTIKLIYTYRHTRMTEWLRRWT